VLAALWVVLPPMLSPWVSPCLSWRKNMVEGVDGDGGRHAWKQSLSEAFVPVILGRIRISSSQ
jgi:hypothetical protein